MTDVKDFLPQPRKKDKKQLRPMHVYVDKALHAKAKRLKKELRLDWTEVFNALLSAFIDSKEKKK